MTGRHPEAALGGQGLKRRQSSVFAGVEERGAQPRNAGHHPQGRRADIEHHITVDLLGRQLTATARLNAARRSSRVQSRPA